MSISTTTAWLLTYLVHSTVFLAAAWLTARLLGDRQLAVQEGLLRSALAAGIVTATLQIVFGVAPVTGFVAVENPFAIEPAVRAAPLSGLEHWPSITPSESASTGFSWAALAPAAWFLGAAIALVGVLRSWLDLRRLLRTRCLRPAGRLVEGLAAAMGIRQRIAFSTSKAVPVPFATGITQPEICCPERVDELAREHRTSLFAHELAHLARRDPAWQLGYRLVEAVLFVQPLNRWARRRLEEIAEHLTDERAAACTGDRLGLARCLVVVAHWGRSSSIGLPATAFAAGPRLDRRVRRLISEDAGRGNSGRWVLPVAFTALVASAVILPAVATGESYPSSGSTRPSQIETWNFSADESAGVTEVSGARTWSISDDRPDGLPDVPTAPAVPAAPAAEAAPAPAEAPAAPEARSASPAPAEPTDVTAEPAPAVFPEPTSAPAAPAPPAEAAPDEVERRREEARRRARERAEENAERSERLRAEAEARAREHAEKARKMADRHREQAEARARQSSRMSELQRETVRERIGELRAAARRMSAEEMQAVRDRSQALAAEARGRQREAARATQRLSREQADELRRQSRAASAAARTLQREAVREHREKARALSEKARRLAEEAELQRLKEIEARAEQERQKQ